MLIILRALLIYRAVLCSGVLLPVFGPLVDSGSRIIGIGGTGLGLLLADIVAVVVVVVVALPTVPLDVPAAPSTGAPATRLTTRLLSTRSWSSSSTAMGFYGFSTVRTRKC